MRKEKFLKDHPICCFCGGRAKSETEDHFPSRVIFRERKWPEGYVFPACRACNDASRVDEQIVALLSRLYPDPTTDDALEEFKKIAQAVKNNSPEIFREILPSANEKRRGAKQYGFSSDVHGAYAHMPLLKMGGVGTQRALSRFAQKLFCALFYKHTGQILSEAGGIVFEHLTNLEFSKFDQDALLPFGGSPVLKRSKTSLEDQFDYRYGVTETKRAAGFLVAFNASLFLCGIVYVSRADVREDYPDEKFLLPLSH